MQFLVNEANSTLSPGRFYWGVILFQDMLLLMGRKQHEDILKFRQELIPLP